MREGKLQVESDRLLEVLLGASQRFGPQSPRCMPRRQQRLVRRRGGFLPFGFQRARRIFRFYYLVLTSGFVAK